MRTSAHYFLEGLNDLGIKYVFSNLGTDHASLIEELARWKQEGRAHPEFLLCPHENVAIHMAAGYAAVTGQGQAALVHVDAGTANAAMGMNNMFRSRLPVMLMAGRAPHTLHGELTGSRDNYVHFVQDPFDIGSIVRPYVKWEYSLVTGVNTKEVLRRAHSVMQSDPPGPVYLTLPRETLADTWEEGQVKTYDAARYGAVQAGGIDAGRAALIARSLLEADNPIAVTSYLGRKADAVQALERLAMLCGIRVFEFSPVYLNVSHASPCFGGFDAGKAQGQADVGLLLDVDVPWLPQFVQQNPATRWLHVDVDPIKKDFPMWGFATDLRVQADCATVLRQVIELVEKQAADAFRRRVAQRIAGWEAPNRARAEAIARAAEDRGAKGAVSAAYVCAELNKVIGPDDVVLNEAIRNSPAVLTQFVRTRPLTLFGSAGGGLGYSGGMALGIRLARPAARVVQVVGDGSFHFSTPTSVYAVAQSYALPILTVVLDNGGWQAVKEATLRVHPSGAAAGTGEFQAHLKGDSRHFERVAEAFGGHGESVDDPADVPAAIARCMQAVESGRAALLHVYIGTL